MSKRALVAGGGGFIGGHLVKRLISEGFHVRSVDIKPLSQWYQVHPEAENLVHDLRDLAYCRSATKNVDDVFNLAADMGGMGFIENNKALCMLSVLINTHLLMASRENSVGRYFFASSACVYNADKQRDPRILGLSEADAYPALPEDGYGWEKLFSERMCRHFSEDFGLITRVARFHNVYGPHGTWRGGREKAPAAICRKVCEAKFSGLHEIEIWGDGTQTRSFMYIDDCINGILKIMNSEFGEPLNLGSSQKVSINELVSVAESFAGLRLSRKYDLTAPKGVNGRNSDNSLILNLLDWEPSIALKDGLRQTFDWIQSQIAKDFSAVPVAKKAA